MLRIADERDIPRLLDIYAPYVRDTAITFETEVPEMHEFLTRMRSIRATYPYLVFERGGRAIGYAYAHRHMTRAAYAWCAETSIYVEMGARHEGAGTALYTALLALLKEQGVRMAHAGVTLPNPDSERLHARMGFTPIGVYHRAGWKHGAWRDVGWYEKTLCADDRAPEPLIPFHALDQALVKSILEAEV